MRNLVGPCIQATLANVTWEVAQGSLVAVVGTVGSGKSSLLSALLGDMIRVKGYANIRGKIAYVPQQAWMQNATLKNNILFGRDFKEDLYEKVSKSHILHFQKKECWNRSLECSSKSCDAIVFIFENFVKGLKLLQRVEFFRAVKLTFTCLLQSRSFFASPIHSTCKDFFNVSSFFRFTIIHIGFFHIREFQ